MALRCEIVTKERTVFAGDVDYVSIPGREGVLGIMPNHAPLLTVLSFGEVYVRKDGVEQFFAVGGGIVEVQPDKVIVLADSAERAEEINLEAAQRARDEARKVMEEGVPEDPERFRQIEAALRTAQLQVDVSMRRVNERRRAAGGPPQFDDRSN